MTYIPPAHVGLALGQWGLALGQGSFELGLRGFVLSRKAFQIQTCRYQQCALLVLGGQDPSRSPNVSGFTLQ